MKSSRGKKRALLIHQLLHSNNEAANMVAASNAHSLLGIDNSLLACLLEHENEEITKAASHSISYRFFKL
jgi:hypothetical protein